MRWAAFGGLMGLCALFGCEAADDSVWAAPPPPPPFTEAKRSAEPPSTTPEGRPVGIVFILVDTLRADHVGAYGSELGLTPHLDAAAERGHVFEQAIATSSWTRPSVASMFTSRYPTSLGIASLEDALPQSVETLAEILRKEGAFQTFGVSTNVNAGASFGFDQGFDSFVLPALKDSYGVDPSHKLVGEGVTRAGLEYLDRRDPERPFFLFLHYMDPHAPYLPHPGLLEEPEPRGIARGSMFELEKLERVPAFKLSDADFERIRYLYRGEVKYCDRWIGGLIAGLEERQLRDEVLLVVVADHGEGLWDHGFRGHAHDLYEEVVRVPFFLDYPGAVRAGRARIPELVSLVDLAPTILAAAGIAPPAAFQGSDLAPLVRGEVRGAGAEYVYSEFEFGGRSFEALRRGPGKLVRRRSEEGKDPPEQLFDLSQDASERRNLVGAGRAQERHLRDALEIWTDALARDASAPERVVLEELDPETLRELQALGYVGADAPLGGADPPAED